MTTTDDKKIECPRCGAFHRCYWGLVKTESGKTEVSMTFDCGCGFRMTGIGIARDTDDQSLVRAKFVAEKNLLKQMDEFLRE